MMTIKTLRERSASCPPWKRLRSFTETLAKTAFVRKPKSLRIGHQNKSCKGDTNYSLSQTSIFTDEDDYCQEKEPYKCLDCDKTYNHKLHLILHQRVHEQERPKRRKYVECGTSVISKRLGTQKDDDFEMCFIDPDKKPCFSDECGMSLVQPSLKPYTYDDCGTCLIKPFFKSFNYEDRTTYIHLEQPSRTFIFDKYAMSFIPKPPTPELPANDVLLDCNICGKVFNHELHLILHQRAHSKQRHYKCNVCDAAFTCRSDLANHQCVHIQEKPYKCDRCDKAFSQELRLFVHNRLHRKRKPCDKRDTRVQLWTADQF